ncbi:MAG: peptidylprolyl isomerase [Nocardioides sp.]
MRLRRSIAPLAVAGLVALAGCGSDDSESTASDPAPTDGVSCSYEGDGAGAAKEVEPPPTTATASGDVEATIATTAGDLGITLDADSAPCTVNSFLSLADQGYFDDTVCHRMTTAGILVLQCGDPSGSGSGGPGYSFDDELSGDETYPAGTLAMANAGPGTNGSQFFVVYGDTQLPAAYTVFGEVDADGVAAVEKVAEGGVDDANGPGDGHPNDEVRIESVTVAE